jgi:FkbM family methyltransferase
MNFLANKLSGLNKRIRCIKYGMFYFRNEDFKIPPSLLINGAKKEIHFKNLSIHEFTEICLNDAYHLKYLKRKIKNVKSIVDIGANQGLFAIAARQYFPDAEINCYEPNYRLRDSLSFNATQLNSKVYYEAVMKNDCMVDLHFTGSDLATTTNESINGNVPGVSLQKVIQRVGFIDILKMDCEGAEWELLEDKDSWKKIKSLTLEYHLWARPGITIEKLFQSLDDIKFKMIYHHSLTPDQGLILAVNVQN